MATILLIAIGLAIDSFAASVVRGSQIINKSLSALLKTGLSFAVFQGVFTFSGWILGEELKNIISSADHWIAFFLLSLIGMKMIYESFKKSNPIKQNPSDLNLIFMSFATSIDALVIGISFAFIKANILVASIVIGIVTFLFSLTGFSMGSKLNEIFGRKIELLGGIILISLGLKILLSHLLV